MLDILGNLMVFATDTKIEIQDATTFCSDESVMQIINLIKNVYTILLIAIPIALIIFGILDLGKAVMAGKEDEMKKAQGTLIKRVIYTVAVFLVSLVVDLVVGMVGGEEWKACWKGETAETSGPTPENP